MRIRRPVRTVHRYAAVQAGPSVCAPGSAVGVRSPYEQPRLEPESCGQPLQGIDRDVPQTALDTADVCAIDLAQVRKRVLAEPLLGSDPSQVRCEDLTESTWMRTFHPRIERSCGR